jgi:hypothetical protein
MPDCPEMFKSLKKYGGTFAMNANSLHTWTCWIQGIYFALTGLWPLISIETFQMVTGRKTDHLVTGDEADHWLVNTVGALVIANAVVFLAAAWSRRRTIDVAILGISVAMALTVIDLVYVVRGTISPMYLVDAAAEAVLIALWVTVLWRFKSLN